MTVYHGSTLEIRSPDVSHSKRFLDFGSAFYVTSFREQAQNWDRRKCARLPRSGSPVISFYELDDDLSGFAIDNGIGDTVVPAPCQKPYRKQ